MPRQILILLGFLSLTGACKDQDPTPQQPTVLTLQVVYQQTGSPVDSAIIGVSGTRGTYLTGRDIKIFQQGYTDKQGRFRANMLIPRDYYTTFTAAKLVKVGNRYKSYDLYVILPINNPALKLEQENIITAQLDTLH